jgi:cytochrome c biogenesis protein CcdA
MKPEGSLLCSKEPASKSCPEVIQSSLGFLGGFLCWFQIKIVCVFLLSSVHATYTPYLILLDSIMVIIIWWWRLQFMKKIILEAVHFFRVMYFLSLR